MDSFKVSKVRTTTMPNTAYLGNTGQRTSLLVPETVQRNQQPWERSNVLDLDGVVPGLPETTLLHLTPRKSVPSSSVVRDGPSCGWSLN